MSLINVNNLTFGYDGSANNIFENVWFVGSSISKKLFPFKNKLIKSIFVQITYLKMYLLTLIQTGN